MSIVKTYFMAFIMVICVSTTFSLPKIRFENFKKTSTGNPAVINDFQHLQIQKVFRLTTCAIICLHMSCQEFQYSHTSRLCITRHADAGPGGVIRPVSGLFDTYNLSKQDPRTCAEIRKDNPAAHSGEYTIIPSAPQFRGMSVKVFCLMNDTHQLEYVTLPNENIGNFPKRSNGDCGNERPYLEAAGVGQDGITVYHKIRISPSTMTVVGTDTTFTSGNKTKPHQFGTAEDCYSYGGNCKRIGTFRINTLGTGMKFDNLVWSLNGYSAKVYSVTRSHDGAVIDIVCGGWCGGCVPFGDMVLYPNTLDIQQ